VWKYLYDDWNQISDKRTNTKPTAWLHTPANADSARPHHRRHIASYFFLATRITTVRTWFKCFSHRTNCILLQPSVTCLTWLLATTWKSSIVWKITGPNMKLIQEGYQLPESTVGSTGKASCKNASWISFEAVNLNVSLIRGSLVRWKAQRNSMRRYELKLQFEFSKLSESRWIYFRQFIYFCKKNTVLEDLYSFLHIMRI